MVCVPGTLLGGVYRILTVLGRGGNGTVYLARHERAERLWAVKEVPKKGNTLILEAELLKKLHHPGLPGVGDILEAEGMLYLVMDYVEGHSLGQILKKQGAQSQETVVEWGKQLCEVLSYLHTCIPPVIYRDLKPSNIMLREDGKIILVDFGTAREQKEENCEDTVCLGTRGYAAPEQYGGKGQTGPETDVYGLGAVLFHLLTGFSPSEFPGGLKPIRSFRPELSGGLEKVIEISTRQDQGERYPTCEEFLQALDHYEKLDEAYIRKRRKQKRIVGAVAAAFLAAGIGVWAKGWSERRACSRIYEGWMTKSRGCVDRGEKEKNLERAILSAPGRTEAYEELFQSYLEDDGEFSGEEEKAFQKILGSSEAGRKRVIEILEENRRPYEKVAYEAGILYFYYYTGSGGKSAAARWFRAAAEAEPEKTLSRFQVCRAEILSKISGYYNLLDKERRTGDETISYGEYWKDLTELMGRDLEKEDNEVTALAVYRELTAQIGLHADAFKRAGVEREDLCGQIAFVEGWMERRFKKAGRGEEEKTDYKGQLEEEIREGIAGAREAVRAVYQEGSDQ